MKTKSYNKNDKAPGNDGIVVEMIKCARENMKKALYEVILKVWLKKEMPNDWKTDLIRKEVS